MSVLGNIIWLVFGGFFMALEYLVSGFLLCCTIIGIPFGLQDLVFYRGHLDCIESSWLGITFLYYDCGHSVRYPAFQAHAGGFVSFWPDGYPFLKFSFL